MDRPKVVKFDSPKKLEDIPFPIAPPGSLLQNNAGFRTVKPVINQEKCVNCLMCYLLCPEGTIHKDRDQLTVDYDFCKGCGICARECKPKAIEMVPEEEKK